LVVAPLHHNFGMMVGMKQRYRFYPHPHQQVALAKAFLITQLAPHRTD